MIPGYSAVFRVALMILVAVVVQITCVVQIRVLGGTADITPLLVA